MTWRDMGCGMYLHDVLKKPLDDFLRRKYEGKKSNPLSLRLLRSF